MGGGGSNLHVSCGMVISINITIVKLIKFAQNTFELLRQKIGAKEEIQHV